MRRLTAKQESFAQAIVEGEKQGDAYRRIYNWKGKRAGSDKKASELAAEVHVSARITELREKMNAPRTLERIEKRQILAEFVKATPRQELSSDQLKAIEIDNKMAGHNEPEQLKVTGMGTVLQKIRRDAPKP